MNNKKIFVYLLLIVVLGVGVYALMSAANKRTKEAAAVNGTVCTMDAFQCPDGSWVGRSGPECQFVCPTPRSSENQTAKEVTLQGALSELVSGQGINITPTKVIEDSRCPSGVQCIQAGTVRVQTSITGSEATTTTFTLNKSITLGNISITLVSVNPVKEKNKTIKDADYRFTWKVVKK